MKKGVDISYANGSVDFSALKKAGIQFVIMRCGYGGDYRDQDDERYTENLRKAEQAKMPWGVYLYSYALDANMARSEAQHALRLLNGKKPPYGVWYDVEDSKIAHANLISTCTTFCEVMKKAGLKTGIYSMLAWLSNKLDDPRLDKYDKWVAQWNSTCNYKKPFGIWQYSDKGSINGKTFDLNYAYKDYEGDDTMTQQEFNKMFTKAMESYRGTRQDNDAANYSKEARDWAVREKLISGTDDKTFNGAWEDFLTREQLVTVLYRYAQLIGKA